MRLIDADALKKLLSKERDAIPVTRLERYGFGHEFPNHHGEAMRGGIRKALRCMEQTPTIDAVPVVRCKDCKHYHAETGWCGQHSHFWDGRGVFCHPWESSDWKMFEPDYFCANGERKDGDG